MLPLGTAAFVGSLPLARLLLDACADGNGHEEAGFTALHAAAENGDPDIARELLARGASRQSRTTEGKSPADVASDDDMRRPLAS